MKEKSRNGTSLREQSLFYFVHKFFPDTINRHRIVYKKKILEVDMFIPSISLVIEYDGFYWHKDKTNIDNNKNMGNCSVAPR